MAAFLEVVAEDHGRKLMTCITVVECSPQQLPPSPERPLPRCGSLCDLVLLQLQRVLDRQGEFVPDAPIDNVALQYTVRALQLHYVQGLLDASHPLETTDGPVFPTTTLSSHLDMLEELERWHDGVHCSCLLRGRLATLCHI